MGSHISKQVKRRRNISMEKTTLCDMLCENGENFPGCDHTFIDRKNWMENLQPEKLPVNHIVWPGTHDSATNKIGIRFISRPFAQCQSLSIYQQLCKGTRVLDIRVREDRRVCHGILATYPIDIVIEDVKKFLAETKSEIIILEIRTEFGHKDPPDFDKYLNDALSEYLIHHRDDVFNQTNCEAVTAEDNLRVEATAVSSGETWRPLWSGEYLRDNWVDTDLPLTKFKSNINHLSQQPPVTARKFFYRVENTLTPQADNPVLCVRLVTRRIRGYARLFIAHCSSDQCLDKLQIFSTDFIDEDFVDACISLTHGKIKNTIG